MPKTARDYESFDAYVDSILLKQDNKEGLFAPWSQASADAEQNIILLRQYKNQLKKEGASEYLIDKVGRYANAIYASKVVSSHEEMKQALGVFQDFNEFLQSDAGNGLNHYSRMMQYAKGHGFDLAPVQSGLLALSDGLELGLEMNPEKVLSGDAYEAYKVDDRLKKEAQYKETQKETKAGEWVKRPDKVKEYQFMRDYGKNAAPIPDDLFPGAKEQPNIADDLNSVEAGMDPNELTPSMKTAFYRPAKDWISRFQSTQDLYTASKEKPWAREPKMEWLLRIMAVRSLVNAVPGDNTNLKKEISIKDINQRAKELSEVKEVKQFFNSIRKNSAKYDKTIEIAKSGTGAAFETWFRDYVATNGLAPKDKLMDRYLPSAEQRVNIMQQKVLHKCDTLQDQKNCLAQIIASRLTVNARRGGMFSGMDKAMLEAPKGEAFEQCRELAGNALNRLSKDNLRTLLKQSVDGHGGKMLESFSGMTGITAQNWRNKVNEVQQPEVQKQEPVKNQGSVISL